jgi:hypothetical protein
MARGNGASTLMTFVVIFLIAYVAFYYVLPYFFPVKSGFADMSCEVGLKPCPEGYFCEQRSCVPILPRYSMDQVKGNMDQ